MMAPTLTIVVPCYNEEEVLKDSILHLERLLDSLMSEKLISKMSVLLFVDDGSSDQTWEIIYKQGLNERTYKRLEIIT